MITDPFPFFLDLIAFDQSIIALHAERDKLHRELDDSRNAIAELHNEIETFKRAWVNAQKEVDAQELQMKELDDQERAAKKLLESTNSSKEAAGHKKEIEYLKQKQHSNEGALISSWHVLETTKHAYEQKKSEVTDKIAKLEESLTSMQAKINALDHDLAERDKERENKVRLVPGELLEKYKAMRTRVSNPVVPIVDGSCSACFHHLTRQEITATKTKRLTQCSDCFRFLYLPE